MPFIATLPDPDPPAVSYLEVLKARIMGTIEGLLLEICKISHLEFSGDCKFCCSTRIRDMLLQAWIQVRR